MKYYTYTYYDESGIPYYVGKGSSNRAFRKHTVEVPSKSRIIIQYWDSEEKAFEIEKWWVVFWGCQYDQTGVLENRTRGGYGASLEASIKGGKVAGRMCAENGHMINMRSKMTPEILSNAGKLGMSRMTVEQHSKYGKCGYSRGIQQATQEQRSGWGRKSGLKSASTGRIQSLAILGNRIANHQRWHVRRGIVSPTCLLCNEEAT